MTNSQYPEGNNPNQIKITNPTVVQDPIDGTQRVLVRGTASGFEQGIAAVIGLFTAGPIGALAAWGTIRGVQGKWTPWILIGIPLSAVINLINFLILTFILALIGAATGDYSQIKNPKIYLNVVSTINLDSYQVKHNPYNSYQSLSNKQNIKS